MRLKTISLRPHPVRFSSGTYSPIARPKILLSAAAAMRLADYERLGLEIDKAVAELGQWRNYHSLEFVVLNEPGDDRARFYLADLANVLAALRRSITPEASAVSRPTAVALSQYAGRRA